MGIENMRCCTRWSLIPRLESPITSRWESWVRGRSQSSYEGVCSLQSLCWERRCNLRAGQSFQIQIEEEHDSTPIWWWLFKYPCAKNERITKSIRPTNCCSIRLPLVMAGKCWMGSADQCATPFHPCLSRWNLITIRLILAGTVVAMLFKGESGESTAYSDEH